MPLITGPRKLKPHWQTTDGVTCRLYFGDVIKVLQRLPSRSVQCVVTSPPYWGLRSYLENGHEHKAVEIGSEEIPDCLGWARGDNCGRCHVCKMVLVFREVRRVLRNDGTVWLNYGDTYAGGSSGGASYIQDGKKRLDRGFQTATPRTGLPSGNLVGVPWRVALALQADGWILRQDIVWSKPSPMPESVTNRCTKAHEYVFLLTARKDYYYDAEAIKEEGGGYRTAGPMNYRPELDSREFSSQNTEDAYSSKNKRSVWTTDDEQALFQWLAAHAPEQLGEYLRQTGNKSDVWRISSQGYAGAHFATFPPKLIEPCILAGTSEHGACALCGAPWRRVLEKRALKRERPNDYVKRTGEEGTGNSCANSVAGVEVRTIGWEPTCGCGTDEVRPCIVLDPFVGSGTTAAISLRHNRRCWGIDLNAGYLTALAVPRIEGVLLSKPLTAGLARKQMAAPLIGRAVRI